jgi:hypothetical protein
MHENRETSETPAAQPGRRSAGEGQSHKSRAHVYEESHSGIVPMNHSNKDGKVSAESARSRFAGNEWEAEFDTERVRLNRTQRARYASALRKAYSDNLARASASTRAPREMSGGDAYSSGRWL